VSKVALSESTDAVPAFDSSGATTLQAARLKVDVAFPRGKRERCELTVLFDPRTGHYLWHNAEPNSKSGDDTAHHLKMIKEGGAAVFADSAGLVYFIFGEGLAVKAPRERAGSLDAAVSASIYDITRSLPAFEGRGYHAGYKSVPVFGPMSGFGAAVPSAYKSIPPEFKCEPYSAFCPSYANRIISVSKQGSNWRLVLRNRFDVEIILDQNFDPVSTRHLTEPPPSRPLSVIPK